MGFKILSLKKYTANCLLSLNMQQLAPLERTRLFNCLEDDLGNLTGSLIWRYWPQSAFSIMGR